MSYLGKDFERAVRFLMKASRQAGGFVVFDDSLHTGTWFADHNLPIDDRPVLVQLGPTVLSMQEAFDLLSGALDAAGIGREDRKVTLTYTYADMPTKTDISEWDFIPNKGDHITFGGRKIEVTEVVFDLFGNINVEAENQ